MRTHFGRQSGDSTFLGVMSDDPGASAGLADKFVDEAYASVKGYVRTYVMHQQAD